MSLEDNHDVKPVMTKEQLDALDRIWDVVTKFCKERGIADFNEITSEQFDELHALQEWQDAEEASRKVPVSST